MTLRPASMSLPLAALAFVLTGGVATAQSGGKPKGPTITKAITKEAQAAQAAIKGEKWADCLTALAPTDSAANKTPYDDFAVNELRLVCSARSGNLAMAEAALAKGIEIGEPNGFMDAETVKMRLRQLTQVNYQLKNYPRTVEVGRRAVAADPTNKDLRMIVAQAMYLIPDNAATAAFVEPWVAELEQRNEAPPELALGLWASACVRQKDDACTTRALEKRARYSPDQETWDNLSLLLLRGAPQDRTLDVMRFSNEVGSLSESDQITEYASLALEKGFPGEAERVMKKGVAAGVFGPADKLSEGARNLMQMATSQATTDRASLPRLAKEAAAQKTGQAEVRLGQAYLSYGQAADAVAAVERGMAKGGVRNADEASLYLGVAKLKAGDMAGATAAFDAVKGDAFMRRLARYWKFLVK